MRCLSLHGAICDARLTGITTLAFKLIRASLLSLRQIFFLTAETVHRAPFFELRKRA